MRGYFGIGVEGISKPMNVGNLFRSAHGFGASFVFTLDAFDRVRELSSDTSRSYEHLPFFDWDGVETMRVPKGCQVVGVELLDEAVELPSFRHPLQATYVLGPEKGELSEEVLAICDHIIKIPTSFCINVATAAALVMYDRTISLGGYPVRPLMPGGPQEIPPEKDWREPPVRIQKD